MTTEFPPRVAFIFPIYNGADNIDLLHETVDEVTSGLAGRYEFSFIYVDDGSRDQSLAKLTALRTSGSPSSNCPATSDTRWPSQPDSIW
jgi:glycosyltransferase involved in cell wall biosynthesis